MSNEKEASIVFVMNTNSPKPSDADYEYLAVAWHDSQRYSPAPRHRQRLMINMIKPLDIKSVLEVGGGQSYFLQSLMKVKKGIRAMSTDISKAVVEANQKEFPDIAFKKLDIIKERLNQKFDLIVASEVLEHVSDYKTSLENIAAMANRYVLITVPSSQVFPIDRMIGHYRHYAPKDMTDPLEALGFRVVRCFKWGFPFHNAYKHAINAVNPEKMKESFSEGEYTPMKKFISQIIHGLFYLNLPFGGYQLIILAEKNPVHRESR